MSKLQILLGKDKKRLHEQFKTTYLSGFYDDSAAIFNILNEYCTELIGTPKDASINVYLGDLVQEASKNKMLKPSLIMIVAFNVPEEFIEEVDRWYREEHIPLLMKADGWLSARRYNVISQHGDTPYTSIAIHELADEATLFSDERTYARSTPWRETLTKESWFQAAGRYFYHA